MADGLPLTSTMILPSQSFAAAAAGCWGFPAWISWCGLATLRDETGALQSLLAGISAAGASIVTINQSTPENGAALVAVTIRTDTMQMSPEELTEKLSRQRMVVGVRCGYNL